MEIIARIFDCNYATYKNYYKDAVKRAFKKDNIDIDTDSIKVLVEELPGDNIQSKRNPNGKHSRTITVFVDKKPTYIIGFSNTGFDEDRKIEAEKGIKPYNYGNDDYHSNSYICQGINKIFDLYYDTKKEYPNIKLFFYLLDVEKASYPHNLSNTISYRELYTIGFEILNIDEISFDVFKPLGFSLDENGNNYGYISFNKFANDLTAISKEGPSNVPAYIECIDKKFDIASDNDEYNENFRDLTSLEYIYTFKTLGAQTYDNFLKMWTLNTLAEKEDKNLKFLYSKEKYNFRLGQPPEDARFTEGFPETITSLFEKIGVNIKYSDSDEVRQQWNREISQYETAKRNNDIRNQELFRNNLRAAGVETKCYLCGCEVEEILEAAHLWEISDIKTSSKSKVDSVLELECMKDLLPDNDNSDELFYKKYVLANSGDNGIWLCNNHHELFDRDYYFFESNAGELLIKKDCNDIVKDYLKYTGSSASLTDILSDKRRVFLSERKKNIPNAIEEYDKITNIE